MGRGTLRPADIALLVGGDFREVMRRHKDKKGKKSRARIRRPDILEKDDSGFEGSVLIKLSDKNPEHNVNNFRKNRLKMRDVCETAVSPML